MTEGAREALLWAGMALAEAAFIAGVPILVVCMLVQLVRRLM